MALGYDPIRTLMDEHQVFLSRIEAMRQAWRSGQRSHEASGELPRKVAAFARFLARDVDELHSAKEEKGLFPILGKHVPKEEGPIGVMLSDHEALRAFQRGLEQSSDALTSDASDEKACAAVGRVIADVDSLLSQHIVKEDFVLFPMAQEILSKGEMAEVAQVCLEIEQSYQERYGQNPLLLSTVSEPVLPAHRGTARP